MEIEIPKTYLKKCSSMSPSADNNFSEVPKHSISRKERYRQNEFSKHQWWFVAGVSSFSIQTCLNWTPHGPYECLNQGFWNVLVFLLQCFFHCFNAGYISSRTHSFSKLISQVFNQGKVWRQGHSTTRAKVSFCEKSRISLCYETALFRCLVERFINLWGLERNGQRGLEGWCPCLPAAVMTTKS